MRAQAGRGAQRRRGGLTPELLASRWTLLLPYRERAIAALHQRYGEFADAEDLVHEAMLHVVQLPDLEEHRVGGLLLVVSDRLAIDRHRRRRRERAAAFRLSVQVGPAPEELAIDRAEATRLARLLNSLSERERVAILGRANGFAPYETAELLGVSAKSVHLALSRARAILKGSSSAAPLPLLLWLRARASSTRRSLQPLAVAGLGLAVSVGILQNAMWAPSERTALPSLSPHQVHLAVSATRAPAQHAQQPPRTVSATGQVLGTIPAPVVSAPSSTTSTTTIAAVSGNGSYTGQGQIISITHSNPNESFLQSLQACLQPGAISLNPQHAGCSK
jgi:RNA polymerase sigma factor (sigma-70 family)